MDLQILESLEGAVLSAARHLLGRLATCDEIKARRKSDNTLVTDLDIELGELLCKKLGQSAPVVCEEYPDTHANLNNAPALWLIDPLDGTSGCKRFAKTKSGQVGFGPLVGWVEAGQLVACCFYHIPRRALYTAVRGCGTWWYEHNFDGEVVPELNQRRRLLITNPPRLAESAVIFHLGSVGELPLIEQLKRGSVVAELHQFGGFANDCVRMAHGFEQIHLKFRISAWDISSALLEAEAGLEVLLDPWGKRCKLHDWKIRHDNPVLVSHASVQSELLQIMDLLALQGEQPER